jgi:predicted nucleic acid-binding protein
MFDTNVFNHLLDGSIRDDDIPADWEPVATHVQADELNGAPDDKRSALLAIYCDRVARRVPTETGVWDVSKFDDAQWTGDGSQYDAILETMNARRKHRNNSKDALIADTCAQLGIPLVTNDRNLKAVAESVGVVVFDLRRSA